MGRDVAVRIDEARRVSVARLLVVAVVVRIPLEFPGERHRAVVFALVDGGEDAFEARRRGGLDGARVRVCKRVEVLGGRAVGDGGG